MAGDLSHCSEIEEKDKELVVDMATTPQTERVSKFAELSAPDKLRLQRLQGKMDCAHQYLVGNKLSQDQAKDLFSELEKVNFVVKPEILEKYKLVLTDEITGENAGFGDQNHSQLNNESGEKVGEEIKISLGNGGEVRITKVGNTYSAQRTK